MNAFKRIALVALVLLSINMGYTYVKAAILQEGEFFVCDSQELMELYLENIFIGGMNSEESVADLGTKSGGMAVCGTNEWIFTLVGEVNRFPDIGDGYIINHIQVYGYYTIDGRLPVYIGSPIDGYGYEIIN